MTPTAAAPAAIKAPVGAAAAAFPDRYLVSTLISAAYALEMKLWASLGRSVGMVGRALTEPVAAALKADVSPESSSVAVAVAITDENEVNLGSLLKSDKYDDKAET